MADATSTPEGLAKRKSAMQETKDKLAAQKAGTWKAGDPWPPKKTTEKNLRLKI